MDINMAEGMRYIVSAPKILWLNMIGRTKARPHMLIFNIFGQIEEVRGGVKKSCAAEGRHSL